MEMTPKTKRRIPSGERAGVGFRVTAALKAKIEEAARKAGCSQSQAIEHALERAFGSNELRMVRGDREARAYVQGNKLLLDVPTWESPQGLTEMTLHEDDMENILRFFDLLPMDKK